MLQVKLREPLSSMLHTFLAFLIDVFVIFTFQAKINKILRDLYLPRWYSYFSFLVSRFLCSSTLLHLYVFQLQTLSFSTPQEYQQ